MQMFRGELFVQSAAAFLKSRAFSCQGYSAAWTRLIRRASLIETTKLKGVDPQARLKHHLANIADDKVNRFDELLPWTYSAA